MKKQLPLCIEAGATILVAGSAVYSQADRKKAIAELKGKEVVILQERSQFHIAGVFPFIF